MEPLKLEYEVSSAKGRWILLATLLVSSSVFLIGTATVIALPPIQSYFATGVTEIQWLINGNLLATVTLLLVGGSLGDYYGRKRVLIIGIVVFTAGAVLSALARTMSSLIAFQVIQGIGSALMIPQSLAIINVSFAEEERGRVIGLWAGLSGGIAALGPWLSGWLVETLSWRAIFLMTLPLSLLGLATILMFVPETKASNPRKLDWPGLILVLLALLGITYDLIAGPVSGWTDPLVLVALLGSPIAIVLLIADESRRSEPLIPRRIFQDPLVSGANAVTLAVYFALNATVFFLNLNLQQVQGYSPAAAGLALLPPILVITLFAGPAGALTDRFGPRAQMISGPIIAAVGVALLMSGGVDADYLKYFLPGLMLLGIGMALVIAPLTKSALHVESQLSGFASAFNNAVSRIAALLAVAVLGAIMIPAFSSHLNESISVSALTQEEKAQILSQSNKLAAIEVPESFGEAARKVVTDAIRQSFVYAFRWAMGLSALLALAGALVSLVTIRNPSGTRQG